MQNNDTLDNSPSDRTERKFRTPKSDPDNPKIIDAETRIDKFHEDGTALSWSDFIEILKGGTGSINGLVDEDEMIIPEQIDKQSIWMLHGVMLYSDRTDRKTARNLAPMIYHHMSSEYDELDEPNPRKKKWVTGGRKYRKKMVNTVIEEFQFKDWIRWFNRKHPDGYQRAYSDNPGDGRDPFPKDYSDILYGLCLHTVQVLSNRYTPQEILEKYKIYTGIIEIIHSRDLDLEDDSESRDSRSILEREDIVRIDKVTFGETDRLLENQIPRDLQDRKSEDQLYSPGSLEYYARDSDFFQSNSPTVVKVDRDGIEDEFVLNYNGYRYPRKGDVMDILEATDGYPRTTYDQVLRRLVRQDHLRVAQIRNGIEYRLFPSNLPPPLDAEKIKIKKDKYDPEDLKVHDLNSSIE